ncbi:D-alanyl-D-alanine carboxypeptidase/D-alanyl-D-alanine endopeptidase [Corynebacterium suedekumii]|uniref:D-alanyl-D-alanine carboxypeptidase/D-alanyl-D-alanine-endopeptidase n=1 Tax=Corynebacterium suedekumii TaxID=3049801 RepID=A0ABY8VNV0_9CORY|nr:D-alanyl-D-alanine carboxypeptidase/D-alanyl-D-alanine-endopeptidase [Corynebacterium suedekumii]WIM70686.1 D-alanyl-D-alanine carboxypeptidase/D-alanyl-D-alanine-endopeptidase [Corynebacterium suedekumii]
MSGKKLWWAVSAGVVALATGSVATVGVLAQQHYGDLTHAPAFAIEEPEPPLVPAQAEVPVDNVALARALDRFVEGSEDLGTLHGQVTDTVTGETVWELNADASLQPASATKILTGAAAILALGPDDVLTTEVVRSGGTVVIRASGDVWLTSGQLDDLAEQVGQAEQVIIDTSLWAGEPLMPGWDPQDIDAGYIAPLEPAMLYGARIGDTEGDVPRSHTPALDVARALADRVGAETVGLGPAPADAEVVATTGSPELIDRLTEMMLHSDNVMAEAIGHEVALHRGLPATAQGATQATLDVLGEHGIDISGVSLADNSGLSTLNLIPPRVLDDVLHDAAAHPPLRPLLATLPVAGGSGTLTDRYDDMSGRGWVRAKTGTLTATSALAGVVTADSGRVYSFTLLSNGSEILPARVALDEFASVIRDS